MTRAAKQSIGEAKMNYQEKTAVASKVTVAPACKPAKTEEGITTGMWVTIGPSVGMRQVGGEGDVVAVEIPAGSLISSVTSSGNHTLLGMSESRKFGDAEITYRAK
jgi:hypothetical protein